MPNLDNLSQKIVDDCLEALDLFRSTDPDTTSSDRERAKEHISHMLELPNIKELFTQKQLSDLEGVINS